MKGFFGFPRLAVVSAAIGIVLATPAFAYSDFGQGKPVTFQDLAGKKFCWDNGVWALYEANGQFQNSLGKHRHWGVVEPGVVMIGNQYDQLEALPDGRIQAYRYCLRCGNHDHNQWATPCH